MTIRLTQGWNIETLERHLRLFLLSVSTFALAGCFSISIMEVVQSVQTPKNGVPMVALKPTFARVYVESVEAWHGPWRVDARLTVKDAIAGTQHELSPLNPSPITVAPDGGRRDRWSQSFTFLLDRIDTYPGDRTLEARVFEIGAANPPLTQTFAQVWTFHPTVYDSSYGVVWAVNNAADNGGEPVGPAAPWSDFAAHVAFAQSVYPVTGYGVVPLPGVGYAPPNPQPFNNLTESRTWASQMLANLPAGSKINLLDNWDTGGLHGYAWGSASEEQNARTGGRAGSVMAQEVSHNYGLWCHTFDVCTLYAQYPRKSGMIDAADIGFNVSGNFGRADPQLVSRSDQRDANDIVSVDGPTADFMSYSFPSWVSSFTYCLLIGRLWKTGEAPCSYAHSIELSDVVGRASSRDIRSLVMTPLPPRNPIPVGEALLVAGYVDSYGRGKFTTSEVIPHATSVASAHEHGEFTLEIVGSDGASLGRIAVDLHSDHPQTTVPFSAFIPSALLTDRAAVIRLKKDELVVAERALAKHAPVVQLAKLASDQLSGAPTLNWSARDPDGQSLLYSILFSRDNGAHWWPLNVAVATQSIPINTDNLPGSDQALFMVRASNFGRSSDSVPIGPYRIPPKSPRIVIEAPSEGAAFEAGAAVLARASAFSWQEGMLTDSRLFSWQLDNDRSLGEGDWSVLRNLSLGAHVLKASVRDAAGRAAEATVRFTVSAPKRGSTSGPR